MSSRLIVKNLPSYLTSDQLKEHILTAPTSSSSTKVNLSTNLTDVKLVSRKDGQSRRFAFLGFKDAHVAASVRDYFDKSFIHTSRIQVQFAKQIDDQELKQKQEQHNTSLTAQRHSQEIEKSRQKGEKIKSDKKQRESEKEKAKVKAKAKADGKDSKEKHKEKEKEKEKQKGVSFHDFLAIMAPTNMRKKNAELEEKEIIQSDLEQTSTLQREIEEKKQRKEKKRQRQLEKEAHSQVQMQLDQSENQGDKDGDDQKEEEERKDSVANDEGLTDLEYMYRRMRRHLGDEQRDKKETQDTDSDLDEEGQDGSKGKKQKREREFQQSDDEESGTEASKSPAESEGESDSSSTHPKNRRLQSLQARQEAQKKEEQEKRMKEEDEIMKSARLFVRNLPFACTEQELREWFEEQGKGGEVVEVHIPVDRSTKQSKGLGFVKFSNPSHALSAYRRKDGSIFQGRLLHILAAVNQSSEPPSSDPNSTNPNSEKAKESLKQQRFKERKEGATSSRAEFSWSMLYMNQDSVATSIADRLGISKSEILNPSSSASASGEGSRNQTSAAVKLALAETHLIKETKDWLEREGLDLESISNQRSKKIKRSDTTILVKNFPYGTKGEELEQLFQVHGDVERVAMSPSGTIALVEMINENEARKAFKNVAYKKFAGGILYLEKAPERNPEVAKRKREEEKEMKERGKENENQRNGDGNGNGESESVKKIDQVRTKEMIEAERAQAEAESIATLYVKNLNFSTNTEKLIETFQGLNEFTFARVQTKPAASNNQVRLSMGYGFVGFKSFHSAQAAMKVMNGKILDGHSLSISFAKRGQETNPASASASASSTTTSTNDNTSTKILVKNLPFEATKQDVRDLFQSHSNVKSVRAPRKLGGKNSGSRGFAFVEFHSNKDAKLAMEALRFTHLLGRHLVLSFAKEGDDAEGLEMEVQRAKNRARLGLGATSSSNEEREGTDLRKRKKVRLNEADIREAAAKEREMMEED